MAGRWRPSTYHWAVLEPERCQRLLALSGTARTTPHNRLFLLSLRQAFTADPAWTGSGFGGDPLQELRTFALIYASWAASQPFYRSLPLAAQSYGVWRPMWSRPGCLSTAGTTPTTWWPCSTPGWPVMWQPLPAALAICPPPWAVSRPE